MQRCNAAAVPTSAWAPRAPPKQIARKQRPRTKYKSTYDGYALADAVLAVTEDGLSLRNAAAQYGVPKTTLADKIGAPLKRPLPKKTAQRQRSARGQEILREAVVAGEDSMEPRPGPGHHGDPVGALGAPQPGCQPDMPRNSSVRLTTTEEQFIADWATALMKLGVPPSKDEIYKLASKVVQKRCDRVLGKQWVSHWLRKYPIIEALDWEAKQAAKKPETQLLAGDTAESGALVSPGVLPSGGQGGGQGDDPSDDAGDDEFDELDDELARMAKQGGSASMRIHGTAAGAYE